MSRTERLTWFLTALLAWIGIAALALMTPCDGGFWSGFKLAAGAHC